MKRKRLVFACGMLLSLCSCAGGSDGATSYDGSLHTVNFYLDEEVVKTLSVKDGSKMSAPSSEELPGGYIIDHWYVLEGTLKSPWSFSGGTVTSDLDLYADFEYETYTVNVIDVYGESHETVSTYKQSYDFSSFFDGASLKRLDHLEDEAGGRLAVKGTWLLTSDVTLTPVFGTQTITYEFYELAAPVFGPSGYSYYKAYASNQLDGVSNQNPSSLSGRPDDLDVSLADASKDGYRFEGWFKLEEIYEDVSESYSVLWAGFVSKVENLRDGYLGSTVLGLFSKYNSVSVVSNNEEFGQVNFVDGAITSACCGDSITVVATPADGYALRGWYCGDNFVSKDNPYTFEMPILPAQDYSLTAVFYTKEEQLGISPFVNLAGGYTTYGLYPQWHVNDEETIASLNALNSASINGWYLLNGEYYAKETAKPYDTNYVFDDGAKIVSGTSYWFKCEPIEWKILSSDGGDYSLVSTMLLDAHRYKRYYSGTKDGYYANNYANSEIRGWLNGDFYSSAFALGDSYVQTTTVDNSAATTDSSSNKYACENTEDKVYLLSYQDYMNTSYSAGDAARQCKTTDYARARGAWYSTSSSFLYNGLYWTRSPRSGSYDAAWGVYIDGYLNGNFFVHYSHYAVRPALTINL